MLDDLGPFEILKLINNFTEYCMDLMVLHLVAMLEDPYPERSTYNPETNKPAVSRAWWITWSGWWRFWRARPGRSWRA